MNENLRPLIHLFKTNKNHYLCDADMDDVQMITKDLYDDFRENCSTEGKTQTNIEMLQMVRMVGNQHICLDSIILNDALRDKVFYPLVFYSGDKP